MRDPNSILALSALLALLLVVAAGWMLRSRLRSRSSSVLAWSLTLLVLWPFLSTFSTYLVLNYASSPQSQALVNWIVLSIEVLLPSLLLLTAAGSFLLSVRRVAAKSNDSSTPRPLDGSAQLHRQAPR